MLLGVLVCPKILLSAAQEGPQEASSHCRGLRASLWAAVLEPVVLKAVVSTFLERQLDHMTDGDFGSLLVTALLLPTDTFSANSKCL